MPARPGPGRKRARLSRSGDFDRVYRDGRSRGNRFLVVHAFPRPDENESDEVRLGVSVGRKVGNAVDRNAVKRALREAFWALEGIPERHDFVIVARPDVAGLIERDGTAGVSAVLRELLDDAAQGEAA